MRTHFDSHGINSGVQRYWKHNCIFQRVKREATYSYQTLTVPEDSAANVLYVNGTLFHRSEKEIPASFKVSFRLLFFCCWNSVLSRKLLEGWALLLLQLQCHRRWNFKHWFITSESQGCYSFCASALVRVLCTSMLLQISN